jgi:hypothetical protein
MRTWLAFLALVLLASPAAVSAARDPVVALAAGATQATAKALVPPGKRTIVLATRVTPAQGLGVLAKDSRGLLHSPTAFLNCASHSGGAYLTCTYKIPAPAAGRYTIVFSRKTGPALSIQYTITYA